MGTGPGREPRREDGSARARTAVVQGASGAIGAAIVRELLARDPALRVVATGRQAARLEAALGDHPETGSRLALHELDPGDDTSIEAASRAILARADAIDLLFHASGMLHDEIVAPEKRVEALDRRALLRSFEANAIAPMLVTRALLPGLLAARAPRVAALSARVGSIGDNRLGGWYGYRASKAALGQLIVTLSIELARRAPGSVCVALHPGTVATPLSDPFAGRRDRFTPEQAARQLLDVLDSLGPEHTGSFRAWDGSEIPW